MSAQTNEDVKLAAIDALRSYATYLDAKAVPLMSVLIANLTEYGAFGNATRLARSIKSVLDKHPKHEHEILSIVGEYESPKKQRVVANEKERSVFVMHDPKEDPEFAKYLETHRQKAIASDPNVIAPDQLEITKD